MYRQRLDGYDLAIEEGTSRVPGDGYFYVVHNGEIEGRFRSLAQARKLYKTIREAVGIEKPKPRKALSAEELYRLATNAQSNKSLLWNAEDFSRVDRMTKGKPKRRRRS